MKTHTVLVTGGAGYIGSHACVELLQAGYRVVVLDNLCNSKAAVLGRIERITQQKVTFYPIDIRNAAALTEIFASEAIDTVLHFAGLKAVGQSCQLPLMYYHNNVYGTLVLLQAMQAAQVKRLVFSSSATVYGSTTSVQYSETLPLSAMNPYGRSKLMIEEILRDVALADSQWKIALLRYFNPIGAHSSGLIGEDPTGIPNNLLPYIAQVAIGKLARLAVFGNDYPTPDGTGIRDYIHVVDLVKGHLHALRALDTDLFTQGGCRAYNLGAGKGYSVLEIIHSFEKVTGLRIPYQIAPRREGDLAEFFANPALAWQELHWQTEKTLDDMIADTWHWQSHNPNGYAS